MTLLAASKITSSDENVLRVRAAIRKVAATKVGEDTPSGRLAREAVRSPEVVESAMLVELASNADAVAATCSSCGTTAIADDVVEWIIGNAWDRIADELRPDPTV